MGNADDDEADDRDDASVLKDIAICVIVDLHIGVLSHQSSSLSYTCRSTTLPDNGETLNMDGNNGIHGFLSTFTFKLCDTLLKDKT